MTDTSGPAAGSCGTWSGERRPSVRPAAGHDPPPALRAAASASAARSAASCSSSSPGTPSPATRTAPNQQKMRDMGELRGPWRAAAERARPCRTPRGSSAPHAAGPTGTGGRAIEAALLVHLAQPPPSTNGGRLAAKSRAPVRFGRAGWPFAPMGAPKTPPAPAACARRPRHNVRTALAQRRLAGQRVAWHLRRCEPPLGAAGPARRHPPHPPPRPLLAAAPPLPATKPASAAPNGSGAGRDVGWGGGR